MVEDEKEDIKKTIEEKEVKEEKEWWKNIPNWMLVLGVFIFFIAMRGVTMEQGGISQVLILMGVVAVLILMSKKYKVAEGVLSPKEAEIYVERDCYRKQAWGQFSNMAGFRVGPVNPAQHRDGRGMYYDVALKVINPYDKPEYYVVSVTMKGPEKGFCSFAKSIGPATGREKTAERTLFGISRKLREDPMFERLFAK